MPSVIKAKGSRPFDTILYTKVSLKKYFSAQDSFYILKTLILGESKLRLFIILLLQDGVYGRCGQRLGHIIAINVQPVFLPATHTTLSYSSRNPNGSFFFRIRKEEKNRL